MHVYVGSSVHVPMRTTPRVSTLAPFIVCGRSARWWDSEIKERIALRQQLYSTGNEGQKICGVFSETASLRRSSTPSVVRPYVQAAIFHARALYL